MKNRNVLRVGMAMFFMIALMFGAVHAVAQDVQTVEAAVTEQTGKLGVNKGITWTYDEVTKTLTLTGNDEIGRLGAMGGSISGAMSDGTICSEVENIIVQDMVLSGSARGMFYDFPSLKNIEFINFNTENVTDMSDMFAFCSGLNDLDLNGFNTKNVTNMSGMFYGCNGLNALDLSGFDTKNVTNMHGMFYDCSSLNSLDLSGFDTKNVTDMFMIFSGCGNLKSLNVSGFDTVNITDMSGMFYDCGSLDSLDLSSFDTKNVTDMSNMFSGCRSLSDLNIGSFDTGNVTNMSGMFFDCESMKGLDVSNFNTQNVQWMASMFWECGKMESLDLSSFDTKNVVSMQNMFKDCSNLRNLNLSSFDTGNVTDMREMFSGCSNLERLDISNFDISKIEFEYVYAYQSDDGFEGYRSQLYKFLSGCSGLKTICAPAIVVDEHPIELPHAFYDEQMNEISLITSRQCGKILKVENIATDPSQTDGWKEENGVAYWYENGVKQGLEGRGKEIYDPVTDAWYWLDSIQGGAIAKDKDVYQESSAGIWGDSLSISLNGTIDPKATTGKWVHYDSEGHMVKGWYTNTNGDKYFFDDTYGTMVKGYATIDGTEYYFNADTGILERTVATDIPEMGWKTIDGNDYWYENYQRMGYSHIGDSYRGKEICDPATNDWYWLDNVDSGKKAVSKDVYQESDAGAWGDIQVEGGLKRGKWVHYDENGHMLKGWSADGQYYFDLTYGTMAKGKVVIDGVEYNFDLDTGIKQ